MTYSAKVIAGGKIVIPADLRRQLGLEEGDFVILDRAPDGSVSIKTHEQIIREGQLAYKAMLKRPFTVDEFIADRRAEAERE